MRTATDPIHSRPPAQHAPGTLAQHAPTLRDQCPAQQALLAELDWSDVERGADEADVEPSGWVS